MAVGEHLNAVAQPRGAHSRLGAVPKRALEVRAGRLYSCQQTKPNAAGHLQNVHAPDFPAGDVRPCDWFQSVVRGKL